MAEFIITGTNRESGKSVKIKVEARDEAHARDRATRHGTDVATCKAVEIPIASGSIVAAREPQTVQRQTPPMPVAAVTATPVHPQPVQHVHVHATPPAKGTSGLGIAALVIGIIACLFSWIPFVGMLAFPIAGIGLLLAFIGFIISLTGRRSGVGMPVAGAIACAVAITIGVISTAGTTAAVGAAANEMAKAIEKQQKLDEQRRASQTVTAVAPGVPVAAATPAVKTPAETPAAKTTPEPKTPAVDPSLVPVAQADGSIKIGDLTVKVLGAKVGKVPLNYLRDETASKDELLTVTISITNKSDVKRLNYQSWAGKSISFQRDYATVQDEHGNSYKRIDFGFGTTVVGQVERGDSVEPEGSLQDLLVFEKPIPKAKKLIIELPGENIDKPGAKLRFEIPAPK